MNSANRPNLRRISVRLPFVYYTESPIVSNRRRLSYTGLKGSNDYILIDSLIKSNEADVHFYVTLCYLLEQIVNTVV